MEITVNSIITLVSKAMKHRMHINVSIRDQRICVYKNKEEVYLFVVLAEKQIQ